MYKLEYLPSAKKDMADIAYYISHTLVNPDAAVRLAEELVSAAETLRDFPYAYPVFTPIRPLAHEYRKLIVRNYIMFYWVEEQSKTIILARVIYNRRDLDSQL